MVKVVVMGRYFVIIYIIVGVLFFCFGIVDYVIQYFWIGYVCFGIWIGIWVSFFVMFQLFCFYIIGFIYYIQLVLYLYRMVLYLCRMIKDVVILFLCDIEVLF